MREIEHRLREVRSLHDTAYLDSAFFLNEFADGEEEVGGELE